MKPAIDRELAHWLPSRIDIHFLLKVIKYLAQRTVSQ